MSTTTAPAVSPVLDLPASGPWDWERVFGRRAPRVLEVGCGKGLFLTAAALQHPERDFLGIEIRRLRAGKIAAKIAAAGLPNARVLQGDALLIHDAVGAGTLSACWINFPDPWPKRRHANRRLFSHPRFVSGVARALAPGGELLVATDVGWYAGEILLACEDCPALENLLGPGRMAPRPGGYPVSIHEAKFRAWGRPIYFLRFRRRG